MTSTILLIALVTVSAITDLVWHRIYNAVTYPGIVLGFLAAALEHSDNPLAGLEESFKGFAACGGLMLVAFLFFNIGGGDVKLLAMQGAFLGLERGLEALLWTFVVGGVAALAIVVWRAGAWRVVSTAVRHLFWSLRLGRFQPLTPEDRKLLEPPLYLAAAAVPAVWIVCFNLDRHIGW